MSAKLDFIPGHGVDVRYRRDGKTLRYLPNKITRQLFALKQGRGLDAFAGHELDHLIHHFDVLGRVKFTVRADLCP
jgi:hypothetical protein